MESAATVIAQALDRIDDEDLVDRWRKRMFTDEAMPIAAAELKRRAIDPDTYSPPEEIPQSMVVSDFSSCDRPVHVRLFSFKGRAPRLRFWLVVPTSWLAFVILRVYFELNYDRISYPFLLVSTFALLVPIAWLHWATIVQRLHDRNKTGSWCVLLFLPFVGAIWALVELGCLPGTRGANRFGKP